MALSYATASVSGAQAVFDALITFLTANGWTLIDTLSTGDKVLHSTGTDGKKVLYARVTLTSDAGNPVKYGKERWRSGVIVRGYRTWDTVAHTGTGEYGRWGPFMFTNVGTNYNTTTSFVLWLPQDQTKAPLTASQQRSFNNTSRIMDTLGGRILAGQNGAASLLFINSFEGSSWTAPSSPATGGVAVYCYVVSNDGKEWIYTLSVSDASFYKFDIAAGTWTRLADVSWAAGTDTSGVILFDGNDTIYAMRGASTTSFGKYTISTNTWTALTALPTARNSSQADNANYIPATASGLANDVIILGLNLSTSLYRYDVVTGVWTTTVAPVTIGTATSNIAALNFDNSRYCYASLFTDTRVYALDVTTWTWTNLGTMQNSQGIGGGQTLFPFTSIVYTSNVANTTYYFLGDADSFTVATSEGGRDWWFNFGTYDSYYNTTKMTLATTTTAGFNTTFQVDDTSTLTVGAIVTIAGPLGENWEQVTVLSITDATHFVAHATLPHLSGSFLGDDIMPYVSAGPGGATTPLDAKGYLTDYINPSWRLYPAITVSQPWLNSYRTGRGRMMLIPMVIQGPPFTTQAPPIGNGSMDDAPGTLRNIYALTNPRDPTKLQSGQQVTLGGKTYIILLPGSEYGFAANSFASPAIAIGPIN